MRNLVAVEFLTLDGVMQGLGSPDEDRDGGFEHGGWGLPYAEAMHEVLDPGGLGRTSAYLFGRRTYDKMAAFWPSQPDENPMAASLNSSPKHVATRGRPSLDWQGAVPLNGELTSAVGQLTAEGEGDIVILGSGDVVRQLLRADLVDELRLFIHPLLLGTGKHLFGGLPAPRALRLTSVAATSRGTIAAVYTRTGSEQL
ncbi:Dihydrofolate reductase [Dietzia kunjamensis subsp. schimae]|uniref:Dihydrofolate reductase n=1 Tax=Dietzia kunjamensis subsp. schimae TaxID=498198 RepID=A0ABY1N4R0_9ACTN|nr:MULTISPECIES: dihydrofolate reductase family protein [Dietzia]MBB1016445.1 dihydrofolate reductase [Dietzia kunjamensis subsp. schimae]MEB8326731.1 dihydrofolate reductase family protein [Dietzia kunjamensis]SMO90779.1 Dihydrofolate reductase [Dietzia kunjamensis subsp. schimae]